MIINPYKIGSRSASRLRQEIRNRGGKAWTLQKTPVSSKPFIVNWGNTKFEYMGNTYCIVNDPIAISKMTNKLRFFETTGHDKDVLEWTPDKFVAKEWKSKVFVRTKLAGSGGDGIVVYDPEGVDAIPDAPLYTRYIPKTHEYRLHMARSLRGEGFTVMLAQRKVFVKTNERTAPLDWKVRSHGNGFIFQTQPEVERLPKAVVNSAVRVMQEFFPDIHFAALDVMYHDKRDKAWVIEGNTAPGLENNTVSVYADYFMALEKERKQELL